MAQRDVSRPGATFFAHGGKEGAGFDPIFLFLEEKNGVEPPKKIAFLVVHKYAFVWRFGIGNRPCKGESAQPPSPLPLKRA